MDKIPVAILGSGNIGTDLMHKIKNSEFLDLKLFSGIDPKSDGLARAKKIGVNISTEGIESILRDDDIKIVFDATGAKPHMTHAPLLRESGKIAIDLTPAAIGPFVVPSVNMSEHLNEFNVNLISCAAQATIPIISAISSVISVDYAEIVSTVSSKSIGPGTRQNIDEFTHTTTDAIKKIGKVKKAKTIVVVNPADPPIMMRNTIYAQTDEMPDIDAVRESVLDMVDNVKKYVPGYKLKVEPYFVENYFVVTVEVEGAGNYLPKYAGNLDIINAAAVAIGEEHGKKLLNKAEKEEKSNGNYNY